MSSVFEAWAVTHGYTLTKAQPQPHPESFHQSYFFTDAEHAYRGWCAALKEAIKTQGATECRTVVLTAPPRIWLQVSDDSTSNTEPFPADVHEDITWCQNSVVDCEVMYIRADLASSTEYKGEQP